MCDCVKYSASIPAVEVHLRRRTRRAHASGKNPERNEDEYDFFLGILCCLQPVQRAGGRLLVKENRDPASDAVVWTTPGTSA
jgi:hypothetical protein